MPDNTFLSNEELLSIEQVFEDIEKDNEDLDKVVARIHERALLEFSTEIAPDKWQLRSFVLSSCLAALSPSKDIARGGFPGWLRHQLDGTKPDF